MNLGESKSNGHDINLGNYHRKILRKYDRELLLDTGNQKKHYRQSNHNDTTSQSILSVGEQIEN
jgi:hypothetical protein